MRPLGKLTDWVHLRSAARASSEASVPSAAGAAGRLVVSSSSDDADADAPDVLPASVSLRGTTSLLSTALIATAALIARVPLGALRPITPLRGMQ